MFSWLRKNKEVKEPVEIPILGTDYRGEHSEEEVKSYLGSLDRSQVDRFKLNVVIAPVVHSSVKDDFEMTESFLGVGDLGYMFRGTPIELTMTEDYLRLDFPKDQSNGRLVGANFLVILK